MKLSAAQIAAYERDGYLIVKGLFSKEIISEIKSITNTIAEELKKGLPTDVSENGSRRDWKNASVLWAKNSKAEPVIKLVSWAAGASKELLTYGRDAAILAPVSQLLEATEADHLINQIHYKSPGDEVSFPWHQDEQNRRSFDPNWEDVNKKGSFVQTLMAIDEHTIHNGPLYVLPGSHKLGYLNFGKFLQTNELQAKLSDKGIDVGSMQVPLLMDAGDIVFMHPRLIHGSWPNTSSEPRCMFINGFSYPGANHKPYPGIGSAQRVSLITGQELLDSVTSASKNESAAYVDPLPAVKPALIFSIRKEDKKEKEEENTVVGPDHIVHLNQRIDRKY